MMNDLILKWRKGLLLLLLPVILAGCRNDRMEEVLAGGPALVTLAVSATQSSGPRTRALTPDNGNSAINSLYVLQFHAKSDGSYGTLRRVAEGELSSGGVYKATLQQSNDTDDLYLLVILANFGTSPDLYSLAGKTYEQVQKACYSALSSGILTFGASDVIPMSGVVNRGQPVRVEKGETYSGIQLLRAVARVDVGIGTPVDGSNTWNPGTVDFRMTDIQVWKAGRRYTRLPLAHTYSAAGVPSVSEPSVVPGVEVASPWDYNAGISGNTVKGGWCVSSIFLPETKLKGTDASPNKVFDANHTNRLAIIVGGYYPAASTEKSWYRIDICDGNSTPETVMNLDILRNTIYSISIGRVTAKGYASAQQAYEKKPLGLGFTAGVKPWLTGITDGAPVPVSGVRMLYKLGTGNRRPQSTATGVVYEKAAFWRGRLDYQYGVNQPFDYNDFYGEGSNFYYPYEGVGSNNGDIYHYGTVSESDVHNLRFAALWVEGAYPALMIAPDDLTDVGHPDGLFPWRSEDGSLTAFDACRAYEGGGYTDWRLPRLSELALMFVYKGDLTGEYPEEVFRYPTGKYWSGNEYAPRPSGLVTGTGPGTSYNYTLGVKSAGQAWAFDFDVASTASAGSVFEKGPWPSKSAKRKVRCVRQIGSDLDGKD